MTAEPTPVIYWFRQDLRLHDMPALHAAIHSGQPVLPCYIIDEDAPGAWAPGEASRWWLHHSLQALAADIEGLGSKLLVRRGATVDTLRELVAGSGARAVFCSQAYEPWNRKLEHQLSARLEVDFHCLPGSLLLHPEDIRTRTGAPFKVFTPFWRAGRASLDYHTPLPPPSTGTLLAHTTPGLQTHEWGLLPSVPDWSAHWPQLWSPGEAGAMAALDQFLINRLDDYASGRDYPARSHSSRLSPHLHWGEISPGQILHALNASAGFAGEDDNRAKFETELAWREFNHHLLYHHPHICEQPLKREFARLPWSTDNVDLVAWQRGRTGYPFVDAGMRELWHTGFMHNRLRMICASFLCKHLLLPWQWGARWFWDTLVDADLANNSAGWQWVAGCGSDSSPWFRIFNPIIQGGKFDADGDYIRQWLPELAHLPSRHLHAPWEAPTTVLQAADVRLGDNYPVPIIDHRFARERALQAYQERSAVAASE